MSIADKFSIIVLVFSMGAQLFMRSFLKRYVLISFVFSAAALFGSAFYSAFLQYKAWQTSPLSVFLLPPYRDWNYFIYYIGSRFFAPLFVALFAAFAFKVIAEFLNRKFGGRFLEEEESMLLALGVFLAGYPGFIFYIPVMLAAGVALSLFYSLLKKGRAPLFYLWLPTVIFVIILKSWIPQSVLNVFII